MELKKCSVCNIGYNLTETQTCQLIVDGEGEEEYYDDIDYDDTDSDT